MAEIVGVFGWFTRSTGACQDPPAAVQAKIRIRFKPSKTMRAKLDRREICRGETAPLRRKA